MRLLHAPTRTQARFDDPNLIAYGGLEPVMRLAQRCGLGRLTTELVRFATSANGTGACAAAKVVSLVAGMVAGADSIEDMDRLRHGAMAKLFDGIRAPSTLGSFLRTFTFGHVAQLHAVARRFLPELARHTPLLAGARIAARLDIDDTIRATYGYAKQGAGYGYSKVKGLNAVIAVLSTPLAAPVIAATRLRKGATSSVRGAASFVTEAISTARAAGATGLLVVRADSAYYAAEVIAACRSLGAQFSVTARMNTSIQQAIAAIAEDAWVAIKYPNAIFDEEQGRWISEAEVAEVRYTAFSSKPVRQQVSARLIVRRVKRHNAASLPQGQGELFATYRYHAVFTDSSSPMLLAEAEHRRHAIVEQVIADLKNSALAHFPSASFSANSAWLALAAIAHNLTRAAGALASAFHAKATTATVRTQLIAVPVRLAHSARGQTLHLPEGWAWQDDWQSMFDALHAPPQAA